MEAGKKEILNQKVIIFSVPFCFPNSGCQYGIKLYDWDGSLLIYDYNFHDNGIGVDDQLVTGAQAKGVAALSSHCIAVGIHTGTIVLFRVVFDDQGYSCARTDSNRCHMSPITDLASTTINNQDFKDVRPIEWSHLGWV